MDFASIASAVLIKDHLLRDNPPNPDAEGEPPPQRQTPVFTDDRPETMQCIEDIRNVIDQYRGRLLCGEVQGKTDRIGHFYGNDRPRLHLPLNFALLDTRWNALSLQAAIDAYFNALPSQAWPVWVIGGHDKPRVTSRIGEAQMRILAMLLMTLRGTPFFYMGDEIGGERVSIPPIGSAIRSRSWCRAMGFAGIPSARRCAGMTARMAASPMDTLGCRRSRRFKECRRPATRRSLDPYLVSRAHRAAARANVSTRWRAAAAPLTERCPRLQTRPEWRRNIGPAQHRPRASEMALAGSWPAGDIHASRSRAAAVAGRPPSPSCE
jgi:alpha-glucosidase